MKAIVAVTVLLAASGCVSTWENVATTELDEEDVRILYESNLIATDANTLFRRAVEMTRPEAVERCGRYGRIPEAVSHWDQSPYTKGIFGPVRTGSKVMVLWSCNPITPPASEYRPN